MYTARQLRPVLAITVHVALAVLVVALRFYVRGRIVGAIGLEDWLALVTLITSIAQTVAFYFQLHFGLGTRLQNLRPEEAVDQHKWAFVTILFYSTSLVIIKLSILFQYRRLLITRNDKRKIWVLLGVVICFGIFTILSTIFTCVPVENFWVISPEGHCLDKKPLWLIQAGFNIFTDFAILLLPMPTLWALKLPKKQKLTLIIIFALGGIVCIISLLRIPAVITATTTSDPSYDTVDAAIFSSVEVNVAIICASLPMLRPLAGRLFPHLWGSSRGAGSHSNHMLSGTHRTSYPNGPMMRLKDLERSGSTTVRIEACKHMKGDSKERKDNPNVRDIVLSTTIVQDIERGPEADEESSVKSLIIQQNRY